MNYRNLPILKEIEHFFNVYKSLEGRLSLTFGWSGKGATLQRVQTAQTRRS